MSESPIKPLRRRISRVKVDSNSEGFRVTVHWRPGYAFDPEGDGRRFAGIFTRIACASLLEEFLNMALKTPPNGWAGIPPAPTSGQEKP
jgi:hypothetical protein